MKLICSYIKCYYIGNTFALVVYVSSRLSYVFQEGYHKKARLERTHRELVIRKKQGFVTLCRIHRDMQQTKAWFQDSLSKGELMAEFEKKDLVGLCVEL
jgi:hypothetical protein